MKDSFEVFRLDNDRKLNVRLLNLLSFLIVVEIFRLPLGFVTRTLDYTKWLHVLLPLVCVFTVLLNIKNIKLKSFSNYFFLVSLGAGIISTLIFKFSFNKIGFSVHYLAPIIFVGIVPLMLGFLSVEREDIEKILSNTSLAVLSFGFILYLFEFFTVKVFNIVTPLEFVDALLPSYVARPESSIRAVGFLGFSHYSTLVMVVSWAYLLTREINKAGKLSIVIIKRAFFYTTPLVVTLVIADSLTSIFVFSCLCVLITLALFGDKLRKLKLWQWLIFLNGSVFFLWMFLHTGLANRLWVYILNIMSGNLQQVGLEKYFPILSGCTNLSLFFNSGDVDWNKCTSGEFHELVPLIKLGLFPTFGWYAIFIFTLFFLFKELAVGIRIRAEVFALIAAILSMIHYGGAGTWGLNYVVMLLAYLLFTQSKENQNE